MTAGAQPAVTDRPFAGQVALVTGAARRTGAAIAEHLTARGAAVAVHYHTSAAPARELVERLGGDRAGCHAEAADLTDPPSVSAMVERIVERSGRIDLLVNNVGTFQVKPIERVEPAEWDRAVRTAVTAAFLVCRAVLPHMRRHGYGRIVSIADSAADKLSPQPTLAPYMVGKTGILILTRSLAAATADCDITVNAVSPGIMENSVTKPPGGPAAVPKGRYGTYADLNGAIEFFLRRETSYITGENLKVSGGWNL
ncbi:MAG: SDR family oxidoreductase [Spirochaetaceae bacterium]|nr:SDR family oxidoreductase [Spirochaetaceae bacterium]